LNSFYFVKKIWHKPKIEDMTYYGFYSETQEKKSKKIFSIWIQQAKG